MSRKVLIMPKTNLFTLFTNKPSSLKASELLERGKYGVYGAQGILGYLDTYQTSIDSLAVIKDGAGIGRVQVIPKNSSVIGTIQLLIPNDNTDLLYAYYLLKYLDLGNSYSGATIPHIYFKNYGKREIEFKKLAEQECIGKELSSIDLLISKAKTDIQMLEALIKSRFIEMFHTIDMSEQKSDWVPLKAVSKIHTGTTPSTSDNTNWDGDILWITPAEMTKESFFITDTVRKITEKGRKSKSLDIMPINTVLLSTRAPIGKVGIVGSPMACNQGFKNFECNDKLNPIFLYTLLKENTVYLNSIGSGTTFMEISKTKISETKIPLPSIELQNEFADFVQLVDKLKFNAQKRIELYQELLNKKMDEYFN